MLRSGVRLPYAPQIQRIAFMVILTKKEARASFFRLIRTPAYDVSVLDLKEIQMEMILQTQDEDHPLIPLWGEP